MRKLFFIFLLGTVTLIGFSAAAEIVRQPVVRPQLKNDSSKVVQRNFDAQKIKDYSNQTEFIYENKAPVDLSWWSRLWNWFWDLIYSALNNKVTGGLIKYVVIAILVGLVSFLVVKIIGLDLKIFTGKSKAVEVPYTETMDNIHEINFNEEIEKARSAGNFRLAVRLFYLHSLKVLNDKQLISWQPEKTNQTYVNELKDPGQQQQFSQLTRNFEYIWYGEFFIDQENFKALKQDFDQFNRRKV